MDRESRKKEYLKCFIQTFSENGIDRTPIKKLAGAANMNEASIYQYFKNKDEIIVDCVRMYMESDVKQLLQILMDPDRTPEDKIDRLASVSAEITPKAKFVIQVLTNPTYGEMCSPIVHEFSRRFLPCRNSGAEGNSSGLDDQFAVQLLILSVIISDEVIGENDLFQVQMEYLKRLLYGKESADNEKQRDSA